MVKVGKVLMVGGRWGGWTGPKGVGCGCGGLNVQEGFGCIGCIEGKELVALVGCMGVKAFKPLAAALVVPGGVGFSAMKALRVWSGVMAREEGCVEKAMLPDKAGVLRWF